MEEIEQLKQELEKAQQLTKELEEKIKNYEEEKDKRWRAEKTFEYYYISENDEPATHTERNDRIDDFLYSIGNYFETEEQAKQYVEKRKIYIQLKDLALRLNKGRKINWKSPQMKYHLYYNHMTGHIERDCNNSYRHIGAIHCIDENFKAKAIEEIGEENLKKLFD